jgi:hypothetical protein
MHQKRLTNHMTIIINAQHKDDGRHLNNLAGRDQATP